MKIHAVVLAGAVVVVQAVAKLSTMKLSRSRLDEPGTLPCPEPDPSLPNNIKGKINLLFKSLNQASVEEAKRAKKFEIGSKKEIVNHRVMRLRQPLFFLVR